MKFSISIASKQQNNNNKESFFFLELNIYTRLGRGWKDLNERLALLEVEAQLRAEREEKCCKDTQAKKRS